MVIKRFEVYLINLEPTIGSEINKSRPCVIISSDDLNRVLNTVIVLPLTSGIRNYPTRINCYIVNKKGQIALDQIRSIDKQRLIKKIDILNTETRDSVLETLAEMFK